jgi:putative acetyltransferase
VERIAARIVLVHIELDDPARPDVTALLAEHLADMHATSPAESVHALDVSGLTGVGMSFWTARRDGVLLGCAALKELDNTHGEVKSMRTTTESRGTGVGSALLLHVIAESRSRGYTRLSLETGTHDYFEPAHVLYLRHGFVVTGPFAGYTHDPNSAFFALDL